CARDQWGLAAATVYLDLW
nr:immunoglobulin heavy chain junction region [Macaca mulatta]MOV91284.1 immunoglobulin heavy chain junction region [Macaca mulatta]